VKMKVILFVLCGLAIFLAGSVVTDYMLRSQGKAQCAIFLRPATNDKEGAEEAGIRITGRKPVYAVLYDNVLVEVVDDAKGEATEEVFTLVAPGVKKDLVPKELKARIVVTLDDMKKERGVDQMNGLLPGWMYVGR